MKLTAELYDLALIATATILMWLPYVLARILKRGVLGAMANPTPNDPPEAVWAERAKRAHANATENLVAFAPLVLIAAYLGISTPATVIAAHVYVGARLVHYVVFALGIPVLRTLAFLTGVGAALVFSWALLIGVG